MNATVAVLVFDRDGYTPASLGLELFEAAQRREVALSDADGCAAYLTYMYPSLTRRGWKAARRIAIDLQGQAARSPNDRLFTICDDIIFSAERVADYAQRLDAACRTVLAQAEKVAERMDGEEAHAALGEISDMIASALVGVRS